MDSMVNQTSNAASTFLDVTTLLATPSSSVKVEGKKTGVVAKVPAVIGKTIVQIYIEALADLEGPALEISNIKHDLNMTGCEFIQVESAKSGKLVISGYIRENIDYVSAKAADDGTMSIGTRRTGMNIPFKCFTKIQLDSEPEGSASSSLINTEENQSVINTNDFYYSNSNEELDFEVAETKIRQVNVKKNTANVNINNYDEQSFSSLTINMAVDVVVLIMQNQFVEIPGKSGSNNQGGNNNGGSGSSGNGGNSSKNENSNGNGKNNNSGNGKNNAKQKGGKKSTKYAWVKGFTSFGKMFG